MSSGDARRVRDRDELLEALGSAGRAHSDATVILHTTVADRLGIHATDYKTMSLIERSGPLTAGEIAEQTGLTAASVTALVDRLERKGFVRRARDPRDRRRVVVEPIPEGVTRFGALFESARQSLGPLYAPYTTSELDVILDFLHRSTERLRHETAVLAERSKPGGPPATRRGAADRRSPTTTR